ncbi:MAG: hypothetical protein KGJ58_02270 [Patescibacteria group bacterium]|nr:hypothetical protein [Patescibacteria group bacterium]MDE1988426.1 hypothetical protein [Patescibacteria group bacterium]MDE2218252.1 hypothetical protein [Patescibacteria group bacterium]
MKNKNLQSVGFLLQPTTYNLQPNRGFAMLFSVLVASLLVVVGFSIFNLALKETTISTAGRESQVAFYAANSGMECALYWNLKRNAFATSTDASEVARAGAISAKCNGATVNNSFTQSGLSVLTSASDIPVTDVNGSCFDVTISKNPNSPKPGQMLTVIESQGHNICGAAGRKVERGLRATIITNM